MRNAIFIAQITVFVFHNPQRIIFLLHLLKDFTKIDIYISIFFLFIIIIIYLKIETIFFIYLKIIFKIFGK